MQLYKRETNRHFNFVYIFQERLLSLFVNYLLINRVFPIRRVKRVRKKKKKEGRNNTTTSQYNWQLTIILGSRLHKMILIVKIIVSRWDSRNISLFLHTFLEINELMMDPVPVNSKFNFPNLSRISPVSGGKPPLFISACKYFCGWPCVNRESLVGRDQWRTSRFGSGRDSVLGKMFTWVSRRRVTAPLGAALCDDLRRYYAQNNKIDSLTYMYRGVCRSDVPTHTRFTLSLREIAKLTSARLLSNESSRLDSQSVSRDLQQGLIRGYFYEKFH